MRWLQLLIALATTTSCHHKTHPCYEPGTPANHSSCCPGLRCNGSLHAVSSLCVAERPGPQPRSTCRKHGESCTVKGTGGGINPAEFATNWISTCCKGLQCRLGSSAANWTCTPSTPHPVGPPDKIIVRGPKKLPTTLPVVSRTTVRGFSGAYKPWIVEHVKTKTILMAYRSMPSKALAFQRSTDHGASWSTPQTPSALIGDGEWSLHALRSGVLLLADGGGRMYRSSDGARTFSNVSGEPTALAGQPFRFNCTDECSSWSVVEVFSTDNQADTLSAGAYFFVDRTMWKSTNDGWTWRPFTHAAASSSGHLPRDGQWGHDEFYSQSQVYQRRDGTFLHSTRMNTAPCDGWAGEQLWKSNDTAAEHWHCLTQAAGGFCNARQQGHTPTGCFHQADVPIQCAGEGSPNWLKPGNHYSHWLRLRDNRLLLTWTHRSNVIDDDGYGTGTRGLISYDDGSTFDFASDYLVIFSQSDDFCTPPVPWHDKEIELCCAPSKGGCACNVGYGNTIQLSGSGDLLTATSYYNASAAAHIGRFCVDVTRWRLPPLKVDDSISFGQPQVVDRLKQAMPDDFLAFGTGVRHHSRQTHDYVESASFLPAATLGREFNWLSWSQSAGRAWRNSTDPPHHHISSVIHHFPKQCLDGVCTRLTSVGSWAASNGTYWETTKTYTFALNASAPHLLTTGTGPKRIRFRGLPQPSQGDDFRMGGTTSVALPDGRGMLFTAIVRWGGPEEVVCNQHRPANVTSQTMPAEQSSIVVYHSLDGMDWQYLSTLADAHDYPASVEGPNEHDMAIAPDRKTLVAVVRLDAGDGARAIDGQCQPPNYLPYHRSTSRDFGKTWERLSPIRNAGCARPRLLVMGSLLLLSGGRFRVDGRTSDVLLWVSRDGIGQHWKEYSLSYHHNTGVERGENVLRFNSRVNETCWRSTWNATMACWKQSGPRQTNAYTSLVKLDERRFLVLYDQKMIIDPSTTGVTTTNALATSPEASQFNGYDAGFRLNVTSYCMPVDIK